MEQKKYKPQTYFSLALEVERLQNRLRQQKFKALQRINKQKTKNNEKTNKTS